MPRSQIRVRHRFLLGLILVVHAGLLAWGAAVHSPTYDEIGYLAAGLTHWRFGRFELYRVNPPLIRMVATLPLLAANPRLDMSRFSKAPGMRSEFEVGIDFFKANGPKSFALTTWARWTCIPFSLLGAITCFRWARELHGSAGGCIAIILWCSCPLILGHGQWITPDVGASALGLAACWMFRRWLLEPSWIRVISTGVVLGLAELTKTTWIVLYAIWPVLWLVQRHPGSRCREACQLCVIVVISIYVLNVGYAFDGTFRPLRDYRFISQTLGGTIEAPGNRFAQSVLGGLPVPLPCEYILGIDVQKHDFEGRMHSYLAGELRVGGWWYYYLYALGVKLPLGTLGLFILSSWLFATSRNYRSSQEFDLTLLLPPLVVIVLVSSQVGFNHHVRYVLPALPFLFISTGRLGRARALGDRGIWWATVALLAGTVAASLSVAPRWMSYFNESVGGPSRGHEHLLDSNVDWGQDLFFLKRWAEQHPEARPLLVAYHGLVDPSLVGLLPLGPFLQGNEQEVFPPGWYAISVNILHGYTEPFGGMPASFGPAEVRHQLLRRFLKLDPAARVGDSIIIYEVKP